jgi:hypothetical protein
VGSSSWVSRSLITIADTGTLTLGAKGRVWANAPAEVNYIYTEHGSATVRQLVYPPQLEIAPAQVRVNTESPDGGTANVSLTLSSLSYAADPTAWTMDWGDGTIEPGVALSQTHAHGYALIGGNSQTWTAVLSGDNQAGSAADSAVITILCQPDIALTVNGPAAPNGATLDIDILHDPVLSLSLADSLGYIEQAHFLIPGRLDVLGPDLSYAGTLFGPEDIGYVFPLTATISNTGSGVNFDTLSVNLAITALTGDTNCDGTIDFGDINPFVLLLTDHVAWVQLFPNCDWHVGDCNGEGWVDFRDINPFVALLTGGG